MGGSGVYLGPRYPTPTEYAVRHLLFAVAVMTVAGCRCTSDIAKNLTEYEPLPSALSFEACQSKTMAGAPIPDVFPAEASLRVSNLGKSAGLLALSIEGADKDAFKLDATRTPDGVPALGEVELPVLFSPLKAGES